MVHGYNCSIYVATPPKSNRCCLHPETWSDLAKIAASEAGHAGQGESSGDGGDHDKRQDGQARTGQMGHALERREVLEPAGEMEDRTEESDDDVCREDRP